MFSQHSTGASLLLLLLLLILLLLLLLQITLGTYTHDLFFLSILHSSVSALVFPFPASRSILDGTINNRRRADLSLQDFLDKTTTTKEKEKEKEKEEKKNLKGVWQN